MYFRFKEGHEGNIYYGQYSFDGKAWVNGIPYIIMDDYFKWFKNQPFDKDMRELLNG